MNGRFCHEVEDGILGTRHAIALELASGINARHKRLIVRFLLIRELDVEQPRLVPFGPRLAAFEQVASFGGRAGHLGDAPRVNNW